MAAVADSVNAELPGVRQLRVYQHLLIPNIPKHVRYNDNQHQRSNKQVNRKPQSPIQMLEQTSPVLEKQPLGHRPQVQKDNKQL